mmetsp:Transcript_26599/g.67069  ORF Transcript_26599/g.67069 Transcript_26599/m.67069 type:complete len:276 (+) Transcript_26599:415-1242(+)
MARRPRWRAVRGPCDGDVWRLRPRCNAFPSFRTVRSVSCAAAWPCTPNLFGTQTRHRCTTLLPTSKPTQVRGPKRRRGGDRNREGFCTCATGTGRWHTMGKESVGGGLDAPPKLGKPHLLHLGGGHNLVPSHALCVCLLLHQPHPLAERVLLMESLSALASLGSHLEERILGCLHQARTLLFPAPRSQPLSLPWRSRLAPRHVDGIDCLAKQAHRFLPRPSSRLPVDKVQEPQELLFRREEAFQCECVCLGEGLELLLSRLFFECLLGRIVFGLP